MTPKTNTTLTVHTHKYNMHQLFTVIALFCGYGYMFVSCSLLLVGCGNRTQVRAYLWTKKLFTFVAKHLITGHSQGVICTCSFKVSIFLLLFRLTKSLIKGITAWMSLLRRAVAVGAHVFTIGTQRQLSVHTQWVTIKKKQSTRNCTRNCTRICTYPVGVRF